MPHRPLLRAARKPAAFKAKRLAQPPTPAWPSFPGPGQYVGTSATGRVHVFVDASLGAPALQNAQDLLSDADRIVALNDAFFAERAGEVSVIVFALNGATDGTGGADHMGCDYASGNAIEVCAAFGHSMRVSALFEAELSECNMGSNLCGQSTGEALSRWCASTVSQNALGDFATAPVWAQDGMPNFVDQVDPTDQNPDSTGCGMAFVSWLLSQGQTLSAIAQAMVGLGDGGTLAEVYQALTGDLAGNAWAKFVAAVRALPFGVTGDDPFAGSSPAPAPPGPAPAPSPGGAPTLDDAIAWSTEGLRARWPAS